MNIKIKKVLRVISKIILILIALGLVGFAGYYVYKAIVFKPLNVVVTNVTDVSATVTWTTNSPMKGVVYYGKNTLLPGPLGFVGANVGYDDRDVSDAQGVCVNDFNKQAGQSKDSSFSVDGSNFDCENVKVTKTGSYYTHSVTIKNLEENSTYNFVVGDGIWSFKKTVSTVKTFSTLTEVGEPMPVFGKIVGDDGTYSRDSIVYITFNDGSESKDSIVYSSAANDDGGWYLDASTVRDASGNVLPLEATNDTFRVKGTYSNYGRSDEQRFIFGFFEVETFNITVKKAEQVRSSILDRLVMGAYASCGTNTSTKTVAGVAPGGYICSTSTGWVAATAADLAKEASVIGVGNVFKVAAAENDGIVPTTILNTLGLSDQEKNYVTSKQSNAAYCNGTSYCSSGSCVANSTKCGFDDSQKTTSTNCIMMAGNNAIGTISDGACYAGQICKNGSLGGTCGTTQTSNTSVTITACSDGTHVNTCKPITDHSSHYCQSDGTFSGLSANSIDCGKSTINSSESEGGSHYQCEITSEYSGSYVADSGSNAGREYQVLSSCSACGVAVGVYGCTKAYGVPNVKYVDEKPSEYSINISELNKVKLLDAQEDNGVSILDDNPTMKESIIVELKKIYSESERPANVGSDETVIGIGMGYQNKVRVYCEALGLNLVNASGGGKMCDISDENSSTFKLFSITGKAYASDSTEYALYLPEMGIYSFELGGYTISTEVSNGKTKYLFYVEANGKDGFQMPADIENPTSEEDVVLSSNAYQITYKQESTAQQYEIKKGINIISFNFVPIATDSGAYTAQDVITQAKNNGVEIQYIATFDGGRWNNGYSCSSDTCTGNNFTIVPGKGYLVYATTDGQMTIPGYNLTSSVPVAFSAGWNLIGVHGYTTAYTARSFIDSINKIDGLTANNVSWWPTSKGKYEGLQVDNGVEYGLDFPISPSNGYFVRISKFKPSDTTCKSLIWNDGGSLNETCGNTK